MQQINDVFHSSRCLAQAKDLATLLGRLNNTSYVIPYARHFTGRLYKARTCAEAKGAIILSGPQLDDLVLWNRFLQHAAEGISINRLVCRWPTRIVRVDSCPQGIGGYCLQSGIAWRFQLPDSLIGRATLNAMEFLAAFVAVLVEIGCGAEWKDADVILSQGDSVSAAKWLASSSFDNNCPMHLAIARSFADFCLSKGIDHFAQWFPGKENAVADILSRDFALSDKDVTKLIRRHCSPLVPQSFRIIPLPGTIIFRIGELVRRLPSTKLLPNQSTPSAIAPGAATNASSSASGDDSILFSDSSDDGRDLKPSPASPPRLEKDNWTPEEFRQIALEPRPELLVPPSMVWLRPIGLNNFESPIHDRHGRLEPVLALQLRGYADADPGVKQQQALPLEVLQLMVAAFFLAMRSCEYSGVQGNRMTTIVGVDDIGTRSDRQGISPGLAYRFVLS